MRQQTACLLFCVLATVVFAGTLIYDAMFLESHHAKIPRGNGPNSTEVRLFLQARDLHPFLQRPQMDNYFDQRTQRRLSPLLFDGLGARMNMEKENPWSLDPSERVRKCILNETAAFNGHRDPCLRRTFPPEVLRRRFHVDFGGSDVLVFLHVQKTGGTDFENQLLTNLDGQPPCAWLKSERHFDCRTRNGTKWLYTGYQTAWACGLHADWTELSACLDSAMDKMDNKHRKRVYHYVTNLREPVARFLSEWLHVRRGATWLAARLWCKGRPATREELPLCFTGEDWRGVSLDEFLACPHNLARNRQTRMLADLAKVDCYNTTSMPKGRRERILLESAKKNLMDMSFFGLTERREETGLLFERVFDLRFKRHLSGVNSTRSQRALHLATPAQLRAVRAVNALDIELYRFATDLFQQRLREARGGSVGRQKKE